MTQNKRDSGRVHYDAIYEGYVTSNRDTEALGRVKVNVPGVLEPESDWIRPMATFGGSAQRGIWAVPKVNANVLVVFKNGEPEFPRYVAGPWGRPGGVSDVPLQAEGGDPDVVVVRFGKAAIVFDERDGQEKITLLDVENQAYFRFDIVAKKVELRTAPDGNFEGTIMKDEVQNVAGKETGTVTGDSTKSVGGKWEITVAGDAKITAAGKAEITAASEVTLEAATVKGGTAAALGVALQTVKAWLDAHVHSGGVIQGLTGPPTVPTVDAMFSTKFKAE